MDKYGQVREQESALLQGSARLHRVGNRGRSTSCKHRVARSGGRIAGVGQFPLRNDPTLAVLLARVGYEDNGTGDTLLPHSRRLRAAGGAPSLQSGGPPYNKGRGAVRLGLRVCGQKYGNRGGGQAATASIDGYGV